MSGQTIGWVNGRVSGRQTRFLWLGVMVIVVVMAAIGGTFVTEGQQTGADAASVGANVLVPQGWQIVPAQLAVACGMTALFGIGFLYLSERDRPRCIRARRTSRH